LISAAKFSAGARSTGPIRMPSPWIGSSTFTAFRTRPSTKRAIPAPTLAVVTGAAMGGGLVLAAACDLRVITPRARFGVPIARTVGNCLSVANTARLVASLGVSRAKRMLLLAETMDAGEAVACGFALEAVAFEEIDRRAAELAGVLSSNAPLTLRIAKEAIRRLAANGLPTGDDLVRLAYGSGDFKEGVSAFLEKRRPVWTGR